MSRRLSEWSLWTCALVVGLAGLAPAQMRTDSVSTTATIQPQVLGSGTLMRASYESLVTARPVAEIEADLRAARDAEQHFGEERERVRASSEMAKERIEVMKRDKDAIDQRIDMAKKGNMTAEKITLETQKKSAELQIKVLERDAELKKTHVEVANKQVEEARARQRMYQLELELAAKRVDLERLVDEASRGGLLVAENLVRVHRDVREVERRVLEASKERSDRAIDAAKAEKSYVEKQLDLLKAQAKALAIK